MMNKEIILFIFDYIRNEIIISNENFPFLPMDLILK